MGKRDLPDINKVTKIWREQNEKGNGSLPDRFIASKELVKKKNLAHETITFYGLSY